MQSQNKKIALMGMLIAAAFIFSYLETMLPVFFGIPGIKPGFANIVIIIALYKLGLPYAAGLSLVRTVLSGFIFGSMYSIMYSLAGAVLSLLIMLLLKKTDKFGITGVSVLGGVMHNVGQILVALVVMGNAVLYYLPMLIVSGVITGCVVGLLSSLTLYRMKSLKL